MRLLLPAIAVLACCASLPAQESPPPAPPPPPYEHRRPPPSILLDFSYSWRAQGDNHGWHDFDGMARSPLGGSFDLQPPTSLVQFGLRAFYSHGYGVSDQGQRGGVTGVVAWGLDWSTGGEFDLSLGRGNFPLARSTTFVACALTEMGWVSEQGEHLESGRDGRDAIRLAQSVVFGMFFFTFRGHGAVEIGFSESDVTWDAGIRAELGRPISPVGLIVGYTYFGYHRHGGHAFLLGLSIAL